MEVKEKVGEVADMVGEVAGKVGEVAGKDVAGVEGGMEEEVVGGIGYKG